jgi:hypothetical protein
MKIQCTENAHTRKSQIAPLPIIAVVGNGGAAVAGTAKAMSVAFNDDAYDSEGRPYVADDDTLLDAPDDDDDADASAWDEFPDAHAQRPLIRHSSGGGGRGGGGAADDPFWDGSAGSSDNNDDNGKTFTEQCPVCDVSTARGYRGMSPTPSGRVLPLSAYHFDRGACDQQYWSAMPWSLVVGCARNSDVYLTKRPVAWRCSDCRVWFASRNAAAVLAAIVPPSSSPPLLGPPRRGAAVAGDAQPPVVAMDRGTVGGAVNSNSGGGGVPQIRLRMPAAAAARDSKRD